jgi:SAM-dependent methyltransferase
MNQTSAEDRIRVGVLACRVRGASEARWAITPNLHGSPTAFDAFDKIHAGCDRSCMSYSEWEYTSSAPLCSTQYLWKPLVELLGPVASTTRVLDVGCGNGDIAGRIATLGCQVAGIDLSQSGVEQASKSYPALKFKVVAAGPTKPSRREPMSLCSAGRAMASLRNAQMS